MKARKLFRSPVRTAGFILIFAAMLGLRAASVFASGAHEGSRSDDVSADALNAMSLQCHGDPACAQGLVSSIQTTAESRRFQDASSNPYGFFYLDQYRSIEEAVCQLSSSDPQGRDDGDECAEALDLEIGQILSQRCKSLDRDQGAQQACLASMDPRGAMTAVKSAVPAAPTTELSTSIRSASPR